MDDATELRRPRTDRSRRYAGAEPTVTDLRSRTTGGFPVDPVISVPRPLSAATPARAQPVVATVHSGPAGQGATNAPSVGAVMRRTWGRSATLVLIGLGAGLVWAWHTPDVYTAETRLSVGSQELSAQAVPGYVLALQNMTSNYARYVQTTDLARKALVSSLGRSAGQVVGVDASPIPESNVLRIEVDATDPAVATRAADKVAGSMIAQVKRSGSSVDPDLEKLKTLSLQAAQADQASKAAQVALDAVTRDPRATPARVDAARTAAVNAQAAAAVLDVQQQASAVSYQNAMQNTGQPATLEVIRPAALTRSDGVASLERWGAFGALAGAALAVCLAAFTRAAGGRRRREETQQAPARPTRPRAPAAGPDWLVDENETRSVLTGTR